MSFFGKIAGRKTKRPTTPTSRSLFLCPPFVNTSIVRGNFKTIVQPPKYVDENEWLAVNVFEFFNYLNTFYGTVSDFCTLKDCPTMSAGPGIEYTWTDAQKRSTKPPAPQYIDYVMTWIQSQVDDENVFPTKAGREFPREFQQICRNIFKQAFRVFAHIYHTHYDKILCLCAEGHFNSLFAHFISFSKEFDLLEKKDTVALQELIDIMEANGTIS